MTNPSVPTSKYFIWQIFACPLFFRGNPTGDRIRLFAADTFRRLKVVGGIHEEIHALFQNQESYIHQPGLKDNGVDIDIIIKSSGLSREEIEKL